jgi:hypothetical protein
MTKYEYDYEELKLNEEERALLDLDMGDVDTLNVLLRETINERAADGWEPLYPFSVPSLWFRRVIPTKRKKVTKSLDSKHQG